MLLHVDLCYSYMLLLFATPFFTDSSDMNPFILSMEECCSVIMCHLSWDTFQSETEFALQNHGMMAKPW